MIFLEVFSIKASGRTPKEYLVVNPALNSKFNSIGVRNGTIQLFPKRKEFRRYSTSWSAAFLFLIFKRKGYEGK